MNQFLNCFTFWPQGPVLTQAALLTVPAGTGGGFSHHHIRIMTMRAEEAQNNRPRGCSSFPGVLSCPSASASLLWWPNPAAEVPLCFPSALSRGKPASPLCSATAETTASLKQRPVPSAHHSTALLRLMKSSSSSAFSSELGPFLLAADDWKS